MPPIAPISNISVNLTRDNVEISPPEIIRPDINTIINMINPEIIPQNNPLFLKIRALTYPLIKAPKAIINIVRGVTTEVGIFWDFTNKKDETTKITIEKNVPIIVPSKTALVDFDNWFSVVTDLPFFN